MSQPRREDALKSFASWDDDAPDIILISMKAGGVGINLTCATNWYELDMRKRGLWNSAIIYGFLRSHSYLLDPWWNPAVEQQAIMRIHRIGQREKVRIRKFLIKDTVEIKMQKIQSRKQVCWEMEENTNISCCRHSFADFQETREGEKGSHVLSFCLTCAETGNRRWSSFVRKQLWAIQGAKSGRAQVFVPIAHRPTNMYIYVCTYTYICVLPKAAEPCTN